MRGALSKLEGVHAIEVEVGSTELCIDHDPKVATTEKILAALDDAGHAAKPK